MKDFLKILAAMTFGVIVVIIFIWLMDRAIIDPIEANAENPVYSIINVAEWLAYIIVVGSGYVWLRTHE